jgi:hypothetical protein
METTCVIQKPQKKQKLSEKDIDGNIKSLGSLPEEVLRHILSFLPTRDAIRTSVLSKRWEFLWVSIPNLDFERDTSYDRRLVERELLMNFVDRALCLRDSSVIKRFTLCCDVLFDASRVCTWISTALSHNVQELNIDIRDFDVVFSLPSCLFTCKTLTSLYLNMWSYILKLPTTICFSNLKILTIKDVTFSNEYLTQQLFSGLPVLEELKLEDCSWGDLKFVTIAARKLHSLSIFNMWGLHDIESSGELCLVMILGNSLKEFYYKGFMYAEYCLYNSLSVEKADIVTKSEYDRKPANIARFLWNLLIGLSSVKLLRLSSDMVKVCLLLSL